MARNRPRTRRSGRKAKSFSPLSLLVVLALLVAAGWAAWSYLRERSGPVEPPTASTTRKSMQDRGTVPGLEVEPADRFEFYEVLPDAEVQVPAEAGGLAETELPPVVAPGAYVLQAGAFPEFAEADKVKAQLALLGVVAVIQPVDTDSGVFHRVRIGPIEDLDRLNRLRAQLRANRIEFMVIPVGE